ncbi:MAG: plasmid pRiA4b ORF-3 family protein [Bacillus sp. (in: Bacteria)]|nr:plasmid pRiA4b ORF-3 family protein [Bacillus sp. (in: firmicutes)]
MNKGAENALYFEEMLDSSTTHQPNLSVWISSLLAGDGKNSYFNPNEALYKDLEEMAGEPVISTRAFDLLVTLQLNKYRVFRRVIVPARMTFEQLHETLQIVFDWKDYHLHEFYIFGDGDGDGDVEKSKNPAMKNHPAFDEEGRQAIMNLVGGDEDFFDWEEDWNVDSKEVSGVMGDIPKKPDYHVKLSNLLPAKVKYIYDFGDNWVHKIEVLREVEDFPQNYPLCVDGEGESPPEDVGGERGYEEFMKVISDTNHPDYLKMATWSMSQGKYGFDLSQINKKLKLRY